MTTFKLARVLLATLILSALALTVSTATPVAAAQNNPRIIPDEYIVVLKDSSFNLESDVEALSLDYGLTKTFSYQSVFKGFAARVPANRLSDLKKHPQVQFVVPDKKVSLREVGFERHGKADLNVASAANASGQGVPWGIMRVNANRSSQLAGNGKGAVTNVAVAVMDSGVQPNHPDLNVAGGYNCVGGYDSSDWDDYNGHGTHVAGTIGAKDNNIGVVGVAPGVKIYAVRVLDEAGEGRYSEIFCGLEWLAKNAKAKNIKVANLSLGGEGEDDGNCGRSNDDIFHFAVCGLVKNGLTIIAAAGNEKANANLSDFASYDESITVSAMADFDGKPGGKGRDFCSSKDKDDTFANFSNFGKDVDIIAPGVCIASTWPGGEYALSSGTSMAAPHVAGAAALYLSKNPKATPAQVKSALLKNGSSNWNNSEDPDKIKEPLLDVTRF